MPTELVGERAKAMVASMEGDPLLRSMLAVGALGLARPRALEAQLCCQGRRHAIKGVVLRRIGFTGGGAGLPLEEASGGDGASAT